MGNVSGGGIHSTNSVTMATWPVWVITVVVSFETVSSTTAPRVSSTVNILHKAEKLSLCQ